MRFAADRLAVGITKAASLADDLVRRFEEQIETGTMPPGARFPTEMAIVEAFGVSRPVVREAFARLSARGLLVSRRGSGAFVANGARYRAFQVTADEISEIDDVIKLLEMRMGFETEMAFLAAQRRTGSELQEMRRSLADMDASTEVDGSVAADTAFHAAIARATQNDYYLRFTDFLGVRLVPSRRVYLQDSDAATHQTYARAINADHRAIYAAIETGDAQAAREAARAHIQKSIARYRPHALVA
ncbi:FadR/GntR family transcriptional regulator [Sphingomonas sp. M1-B02]|uniref:FadR/GntR family transcriptional regulator n=1 Tax=Sphingomonas sp. M1-B02 TaxID=3114300 RepID=UPI002240D531|nr:FadR/GntR family transcriptional regulator [Sphingomonas sp. S6-11]UZK65895.1 FadR family transcriptional regulator [Sphingomonas sp. S6-11]